MLESPPRPPLWQKSPNKTNPGSVPLWRMLVFEPVGPEHGRQPLDLKLALSHVIRYSVTVGIMGMNRLGRRVAPDVRETWVYE